MLIGKQADIRATLKLRAPATLAGSTERPNLHLSCELKPTEDCTVMAGLLADILIGKPNSFMPQPVVLAPPGEVPATIIYCVSKAEVEAMRNRLDQHAALRGKVRLVVENAFTCCQAVSDAVRCPPRQGAPRC